MKGMLRKEALKNRAALSEAERSSASKAICERFLLSEEYKRASTILLYKAYNSEVDTDMIFTQAVTDGKTVAYPRSNIIEGEPVMEFYIVDDLSQLKAGYKGILEPDPDIVANTITGPADICIAPGAAFDRKCHRIGYGMAFYDRYLRLIKPHLTIGLAYDIQIVDEFETDERDLPVDKVITQSEIIYR